MPRLFVSLAMASATWPIRAVFQGGGQADGCGEHGAAFDRDPVHRLFERNDRDAQARLFDEVLLNRVDALRVSPGRAAVLGGRVCRPKIPLE
jgi:hypothetical protein